MAATGQTINDRLNAVRYALVGQGLARTVCKSTTEEILGPKKKHLDYLVICTNEPNVSIPHIANLLIERTQHSNWAVVFKSLISVHHLMSYGNERFKQYLATSNHSFELNDFMDRTTPQGYNMSTFIRRYAKYINEKTISYRTLALDLCKIRSGNDNALRTMNMENLSKTLPVVQSQFDALLEFGADAKDLNNGVIMAAFRLLYKDLVRLYVAYQEAIINLLERYFKLNRRKTREALEMYKKYLNRMDRVAGFLRIVDAVGLDKSEMPDLTKSPASILNILEKHLSQLEAKKRGTTPASPDHDNNNDESDPEANKENEQQSDQSKKEPSAAAHQQQSSNGARSDKTISVTPADDSRPAAPESIKKQPPARPSPITSPKASPSGQSKASTSAGAERPKVPAPERPAKPPSRPPPPPSASVSVPLSPPSASGNNTSPRATHNLPPQHPPPPSTTKTTSDLSSPSGRTTTPVVTNQDEQQPPATSSEIVNEESGPAAPSSRSNDVSDRDSGNENGNGSATTISDDHEPEQGRTSCALAAAAMPSDHLVDEQDGSGEVEANHVSNNVNSNNIHYPRGDYQGAMPPPSPPIDEPSDVGGTQSPAPIETSGRPVVADLSDSSNNNGDQPQQFDSEEQTANESLAQQEELHPQQDLSPRMNGRLDENNHDVNEDAARLSEDS